MSNKQTISLCTFIKNEEHCIEHMFKSVLGWVDEVVVLDTGSTDRSVEICKDYDARVYEVGFSDFGKIRTLSAHLGSCDWILMLDADETLSYPDKLQDVLKLTDVFDDEKTKPVEAIGLPRKRWLDLEMTEQVELEAYPDLQVRLFQNYSHFGFRRALHEEFYGGAVTPVLEDGPVINHFQDVFKDEIANKVRRELYEKLAPAAGVRIDGGKPIE